MMGPPAHPMNQPAVQADFPPKPLARSSWLRRALGEEGTGFLTSFLLHLICLLLLSIPFLPPRSRLGGIPAIVVTTDLPKSRQHELESIDMDVVPSLDTKEDQPRIGEMFADAKAHSDLLTPSLLDQPTLKHNNEANTTSGEDTSSASTRQIPENAVVAGHFAAWWIPKAERYGEQVKPGQLPRVGQDYRIIVQLQIPEGRKSLRITDLSGEIVGSDGYKQRIPDRAWIYNAQGKLVPVRGHPRLKVIDGTIQIVFKVPGAGKQDVRDTITVRSKLLDEEQTLTLIFQPVKPAP